MFHHIINPKTGYPENSDICSITLIGKDACQLDAYATALFHMDLVKGLSMLKKYSIEAILVLKDGHIYTTNQIKKMIVEE